MPNTSIDSQFTGTPHSRAVSRSAAVARSCRPNCVCWNTKIITTTTIAVTAMITMRCVLMLAPNTVDDVTRAPASRGTSASCPARAR